MLGGVKGLVGFGDEEFRGGFGEVLGAGDAHADGYVDRTRCGLDGGRRDLGAYAFGDVEGVCGMASGQYDHELFAAVAPDDVVLADGALEALGEGDEDLVAGLMTVGVVDGFEVVEVGQDAAYGLSGPSRAVQFDVEGVEDGLVIEDAGHGIALRLPAKLFAGGDDLALKVEYAFGGLDADAQLDGVVGLGDEVVGAGVHGFDEIGDVVADGHDDDVGVVVLLIGFPRADAPAEVDAFEVGHHPIENGHGRRSVALQDAPGLFSGFDGDDLVAPFFELPLDLVAAYGIVVGDEDFHDCPAL